MPPPQPQGEEHAELLAGLQCSPKQIPCSYLYDDRGSELYNQITELEEYYPFKTEEAMLKQHASDIITHIPPGSVVVELGCGSAQKTAFLLSALLARDGPEACTFAGIDVSAQFLQQAKNNLLAACPKLIADQVELVQATYMDGLREVRRMHPDAVLCILWLGSSAGNLDPSETVAFFQDMLAVGGPKTEVLLCTDLWKDKAVLHAAYCDSKGVTEAFIKNGMQNALQAVSRAHVALDMAKWQYDVVVNEDDRQVEMYLIAGHRVSGLGHGLTFQKGERILMEISRKFTQEQLRSLAFRSGYYFQARWRCPEYSIQLLCAPAMALQLCWRDTDRLFAQLPDWSQVPINIRHPFCFYYGHNASLAKLQMLQQDKPSEWDVMFSRGIDPDVSDPSKCHDHPDAPSQWPPKADIVSYVNQVREQLLEGVSEGRCSLRSTYLSLEHERMHQETLCYMMAQHQKRRWEASNSLSSPADSLGAARASGGEGLAHWQDEGSEGSARGGRKNCVDQSTEANSLADGMSKGTANGHAANGHAGNGHAGNGHAADGHVANGHGGNGHAASGHTAHGHAANGHVANGHAANGHAKERSVSVEGDTSGNMVAVPAGDVVLGADVDPSKVFVWDNEGPLQAPQHVKSFKVAARPVTIAEFRAFVVESKGYSQAELWEKEDFDLMEANGQRCPSTWTLMDGGEVFVHFPEGTVHWMEVAERPVWCSLAEARAYCKGRSCRIVTEPEYLRAVDTDPAGTRIKQLDCDGWEWTDTAFAPLEGFQAMREYPEYSTDFFDGKHFVLRGASPYTHASLIRGSFRNFYQSAYPYMFAKFRCCT
jgi:dimethylhistidine N-methyltransferase